MYIIRILYYMKSVLFEMYIIRILYYMKSVLFETLWCIFRQKPKWKVLRIFIDILCTHLDVFLNWLSSLYTCGQTWNKFRNKYKSFKNYEIIHCFVKLVWDLTTMTVLVNLWRNINIYIYIYISYYHVYIDQVWKLYFVNYLQLYFKYFLFRNQKLRNKMN